MPYTPRQLRKPLIAAILPVFNEELNVSGVLDVLHASSVLDEIILVDDGSSDRTIEILNQAGAVDQRIRVIRHEQNRGKGQAIFSGWAATCAPILLLLDADLKDLTPEHLNALLAPVIDHRADIGGIQIEARVDLAQVQIGALPAIEFTPTVANGTQRRHSLTR